MQKSENFGILMVAIGLHECNLTWRNHPFTIWHRLLILASDSFICKASMGAMQGISEMAEVYARYHTFPETGNDSFKQVVVIFSLVDVFSSTSIILRHHQML